MSNDPFKRSGKETAKTLAWFLGAVGVLVVIIHYAPIISHGG